MRTRQIVQQIGGLLHDIVSFLEEILCRRVRSRLLSVNQLDCRAIIDFICDVHIQNIPIEMDFVPKTPMRLYSYNWVAICIIENPIFRESTKHMKQIYIVRGIYDAGIIDSKLVPSTNQLANLLTQPL